MPDKSSIFLIGPMGAGKTTVGRRLARILNLEFVDSDAEINKKTGVDTATIFEIEGEDGFRKRETRALEELSSRGGIVLATGGGAVLKPENRELLKSRGFVVYLTVPLELQLRRTRRDRKRPLLQTPNPRKRLQQLNRERDPLYRETAHWIVDTQRNDSQRLARELATHIRNNVWQDDSTSRIDAHRPIQ
ncbi:shikimate kinase AroK [Acidihalobacter ferrooxydans]|uniref:Shikimate kinase n=1 Tax=Acidihalobacter ferrooxydans TaxID=1765967 RepID=A0A1P8UKM2_9GAMM|nr:shikimate kinase AroK [Acidihalobacter ferrooxydans]APZ44322.1 shikimate kinase I [Acidihalobacter ferrooxydans]